MTELIWKIAFISPIDLHRPNGYLGQGLDSRHPTLSLEKKFKRFNDDILTFKN